MVVRYGRIRADARKCDFRKGTRLGTKDHLIKWEKPARPSWMDEETYQNFPVTIILENAVGRDYLVQQIDLDDVTKDCVVTLLVMSQFSV